MFGKSLGGARAYANVGLETGVAAASAHELIVMLFDGASIAISTAIQEINKGESKNVAAKGAAISKAARIINEGLRASLDMKAGGDLARQLDALYHYIGTELILANADNNAERMAVARGLLQEIADAWKAISPSTSGSTPGAGLAAA